MKPNDSFKRGRPIRFRALRCSTSSSFALSRTEGGGGGGGRKSRISVEIILIADFTRAEAKGAKRWAQNEKITEYVCVRVGIYEYVVVGTATNNFFIVSRTRY